MSLVQSIALSMWCALILVDIAPQVLEYEVRSEGDPIGSIRVELRAADPHEAYSLEISTNLRVRKWFVTLFSLESRVRARIDEQGLSRYHETTVIDGHSIEITGHRTHDHLLLEVEFDGQRATEEWPLSAYDTTSLGWDDFAVRATADTLRARVLDLDELAIRPTRFVARGDTTALVGTDTLRCRVVEATTIDGERTRSWVSSNPPHVLVREFGKDEDGDYEIRLLQIVNEEIVE